MNWRAKLKDVLFYTGGYVYSSNYLGGNGGTAFSDESVWQHRPITGIRLHCGAFLNLIQVRYGDEWGPAHGKTSCNSGQFAEYNLSSTEFIHRAEIRHAIFIDSILITTSERTLPICGGSGGTETTVSGERLVYISGRSDCHVDGLQLHWFSV